MAMLYSWSGRVIFAISTASSKQIEGLRTRRTLRLRRPPTPLPLTRIVVVVVRLASQAKCQVSLAKRAFICGEIRIVDYQIPQPLLSMSLSSKKTGSMAIGT